MSAYNKTTNLLRYTARYSLLLIAGVLLAFSLLSGSLDYGGNLMAIFKNSPNALPWFVLIMLIFIAWKREMLGGILIVIYGIGLVYFFNFSGPNFWWSTFVLTALIPVLGSLFVLSWYIRKHN
ncbi:hypothetical protein [uncultured Psychroserpens sp.]|uniref:DUF7670 domain-containing protein n=1 Tax=uncultured Psychroserpens sp. TaxID=255436 RepID=UPI002621790D|nr:hypothetical protein [uncultured Psychroserpens sp.]